MVRIIVKTKKTKYILWSNPGLELNHPVTLLARIANETKAAIVTKIKRLLLFLKLSLSWNTATPTFQTGKKALIYFIQAENTFLMSNLFDTIITYL